MESRHAQRDVPGFRAEVVAHEGIQVAAAALLSGIDPMEILECHDPIRLLALGVVIEKVAEAEANRRQDLANRIAQAMNGGGN